MMEQSCQKKRYHERKTQGLCVVCGKVMDRGGTLCQVCGQKANDYQKETYHYMLSIGICPRCRKEKLYGDEKVCLLCKAKRKEYLDRKKKQKEGGVLLTTPSTTRTDTGGEWKPVYVRFVAKGEQRVGVKPVRYAEKNSV